MDRAECVICGVGFPVEDLVDVRGGARCPRCFALTSTGHPRAVPGGDGPEEADPVGRSDDLIASVRGWAAGRSWWIRAPVLLWMVWILVHYWSAPWYSTVFSGIDLAIHEIGHILWAPFGPLLAAAGGTLTQLLAPVVTGIVFARQRDWFAVSFAVCWLGINCFEIVQYAGDALVRQLPLVSPMTGSPQHDWAYLLSRLGILRHTDTVAAAWQWAGRLVMTTGIAFGAWVLWLMYAGDETGPGEQPVERAGARTGERAG